MRLVKWALTALWASNSLLGASNVLEERFELATDELINLSGNAAAIQTISPLPKDLNGLTKRLRERVAKGITQDRLIFYEKRKPRRESTRRALLPIIAVELIANADPLALGEALNAEYRGPLKLEANIHLFEIRDYTTILSTIKHFFAEDSVLAAWPQLGRIHSKHYVPNDPYFDEQWHLQNSASDGVDINAPSAWDTATGKGIRIGIVDDGVQVTHPDLLDNADSSLDYDFIEDRADSYLDLQAPDEDDGYPSDEDFHGTLVAGIAAAKGNNSIGSSGVAPDASIVAMRLIGGYTSDAMEAQAFLHEWDSIQIKNNSWGPPGFGDIYSKLEPLAKAALELATDDGRQGLGTIFVWAAGNGGEKKDNSNKDGYSNSPFTLAVTAVDERGLQTSYAENGSNIVVSAPSGGRSTRGLLSTDLQGNDGSNNESRTTDLDDRDYSQHFNGTSASAPIVAGVAALMLEANPDLNWRDVQEIIMRTAQHNDSEDAGWFENAANPPLSFNPKYGSGLVDAAAAVNAAQSWTNLAPRKELSQRPSATLPIEIPDNANDPTSFSFLVSGSNLRVEHAQIRLSIDHERRGDLEIELESPNGTTSQLLAHSEYDEEAHIVDFTFMSVHFWGESGDGAWKLHVKDWVNGYAGRIQQATLILSGVETSGNNLPDKPSQLSVFRSSNVDVNLAWQDNSNNETGFRVERSIGADQPWEIIETLPTNVTSYHDSLYDDSLRYYYRVCAINGSLQSNYTEPVDSYRPWGESEDLFYANFDETQGYQLGQNINNQNGWLTISNLNSKIVGNQFPNLGNQLRVGGYGFDGIELYNSAYKVAPYFPQDNSRARFSCKFAVKSNGEAIDNFGFSFYGLAGEFLFAIDFDAFYEEIESFNDDYNYKNLNASYTLEQTHDLEIIFDFSQNAWSAKLDGQSFAISAKIANTPASEDNLGLYYIEAYYSIHDQNSPGNNYMLVDEMRLEQFAVDAPTGLSELNAYPSSSSEMVLQWVDASLATNYHIERRQSGESDWQEIDSIPVSAWPYYYIDTNLSPVSDYEYRVRSSNSFGFSEYTETVSAQTENRFQDWLAQNDLDKDSSHLTNVEGTDYSLLQAFAMGISAERFTASSTPRVEIDVENQRVTLTYYKSRDDVTYTVKRRLASNGQWSDVGVTQIHSNNGRLITAACPISDTEATLLRLHMELQP